MTRQTTCNCPEISDQDWHMKDQDWSGRIFYFDYLQHFFNLPLGFAKRLSEIKLEIARKGYQLLESEVILYQPGLFQGRILLEIKDPEQYDANVEVFENARVLSRVFSGPRNKLGAAVAELKAFTLDRTHIEPGIIYYWHTTCPVCTDKRGGDKTVLFARV